MFIADRDGENVIVGTKDGWIIFYTVETMEVIKYDRCGHDSVSSLLATSNGRVVSTALDVVRIWNPKTGMETVLFLNVVCSIFYESLKLLFTFLYFFFSARLFPIWGRRADCLV